MPPQTIGEAIEQKRLADETASTSHAAAIVADEQATSDQEAANKAALALKDDLVKVGDTYVEAPEGGIVVYIVDGSDQGYHVIRPAPASTPLD